MTKMTTRRIEMDLRKRRAVAIVIVTTVERRFVRPVEIQSQTTEERNGAEIPPAKTTWNDLPIVDEIKTKNVPEISGRLPRQNAATRSMKSKQRNPKKNTKRKILRRTTKKPLIPKPAARRRKLLPRNPNLCRTKTKKGLRKMFLPLPRRKKNPNPTKISNREKSTARRPHATIKSAAIEPGTEVETTMPRRIVEIEITTEIETGITVITDALRRIGTDELATVTEIAAARNERAERVLDLELPNVAGAREEAETIATNATVPSATSAASTSRRAMLLWRFVLRHGHKLSRWMVWS